MRTIEYCLADSAAIWRFKFVLHLRQDLQGEIIFLKEHMPARNPKVRDGATIGLQFHQSIGLRFLLYFRNPDRICSTLEEQFGKNRGGI